ncbi:MAG: type II toxin-antitoxin system VapC family toxin [Planctomycetota bacterium]
MESRAIWQYNLLYGTDGLGRFEAFVSDLVVEEVSAGDTDPVARRLEAIDRFEVLETTPTAEQLATRYLERIPILESAVRDAFHLAIASASMMDYLVTWNCAHIARAEVRQAVRRENEALRLEPVTICTPEELLGE